MSYVLQLYHTNSAHAGLCGGSIKQLAAASAAVNCSSSHNYSRSTSETFQRNKEMTDGSVSPMNPCMHLFLADIFRSKTFKVV